MATLLSSKGSSRFMVPVRRAGMLVQGPAPGPRKLGSDMAATSSALTPMMVAQRAASGALLKFGHKNCGNPVSPDGDPPPFTKSASVEAVDPESVRSEERR